MSTRQRWPLPSWGLIWVGKEKQICIQRSHIAIKVGKDQRIEGIPTSVQRHCGGNELAKCSRAECMTDLRFQVASIPYKCSEP